MRPSPLSSSESGPALQLRIEPSRFAWLWWAGLHALLIAAALSLGAPWFVRLALLAAVVCHAAVRRPSRTPYRLVVGADGRCEWVDEGAERLPLGPRTLVCSLWIRLDVGTAPRRRDLLVFADQLSAADWARLRARLQRTRGL